MANVQSIRCPVCGSQIPFDPYALVRGESFACPTCPDVSIGLDQGSRDIVKNTLDQLDSLKKKLEDMRSERPAA